MLREPPIKAAIAVVFSIGALIVNIGIWGTRYFKYNMQPQNRTGDHLGPCSKVLVFWLQGCRVFGSAVV